MRLNGRTEHLIKTEKASRMRGQVSFCLINTMIMLMLSSCGDITEAENSSVRSSSTGTIYAGEGASLIYPSNPIVLTGNENLNSPSFDEFLEKAFITNNFRLEEKCSFTPFPINPSLNFPTEQTPNECIRVKNDNNPDESVLQSNEGSWLFPTYSDEFYQVNTFYHLKTIQQRFLASLGFAYSQAHFSTADAVNSRPMILPPAAKHNMGETHSFWLHDSNTANPDDTSILTAFSKCELEDMNSYFDPALRTICFGWNDDISNFRMAQDPSVIYHEFGHVLVKIMMNQRNTTVGVDPFTFTSYETSTLFHSDLGSIFYDEAGALNEGIADYFAYYMNNRKRIGEWGMGRFFDASRPLSELDGKHADGISTDPTERLSYPNYVHYDSNNTDQNFEDIHLSGQIVSHYMVALSEKLKTTCTIPTKTDSAKTQTQHDHTVIGDYMILVLNETLAEIGDLTSKGSDLFSEYATFNSSLQDIFYTNLNDDEAFLWTHQVNPPNFRRFFKIFAKNIKYRLSNGVTGLCPSFTDDQSEQLLDEYGLLLFKSYDEAGIGYDIAGNVSDSYVDHAGTSIFPSQVLMPQIFSTEVDELNRRNSVLVSKDFIDLPTDQSIAYVFDGKTFMDSFISSLTFEGQNVQTSTGIAGTEYNNNNVKISPGEIVGVSLNLINNSNSPMAGVQILANDWDHMKLDDTSKLYINRDKNVIGSKSLAKWKPCTIDGWPLSTEGGQVDPGLASDSTTSGNCDHQSKTNSSLAIDTAIPGSTFPYYDLDTPQPICIVQQSDVNETKWVSQDYYRSKVLELEDSKCLNNPNLSGDNFNPNECLIRALPGANQAVLSKIDPQKTWAQTLQGNNSAAPTFNSSGIILLEVNKWIQPGTQFNCRVRVRFTNCIDCYNDNNSGADYPDYMYTGHEPFKVINFSFKVID